jgi:hypothetical protein
MSFKVKALVGEGRFLVEGEDQNARRGAVVLVSRPWADVLAAREAAVQEQALEAKLLEIFGDVLEDAAEEDKGDLTKVVIESGHDRVPGHHVHLDHNGVVLNAIDQGLGSRVVWVGSDLEVLQG